MNPNLFVYGTLLSVAGHPMGQRLSSEARLVGAASIAGRLYRLGWYPGLVEANASAGAGGALVHGEVYALDDPARSLVWLDAYESIVPGDEANSEYARVERAVRLASGQEATAWVYLFQRDVAGLEFVADGRWVAGRLGRE
jgi:gamma-glutamylcyclotransferase (GGCT)/AIG2-like uncharacterized protein YtfP